MEGWKGGRKRRDFWLTRQGDDARGPLRWMDWMDGWMNTKALEVL